MSQLHNREKAKIKVTDDNAQSVDTSLSESSGGLEDSYADPNASVSSGLNERGQPPRPAELALLARSNHSASAMDPTLAEKHLAAV